MSPIPPSASMTARVTCIGMISIPLPKCMPKSHEPLPLLSDCPSLSQVSSAFSASPDLPSSGAGVPPNHALSLVSLPHDSALTESCFFGIMQQDYLLNE